MGNPLEETLGSDQECMPPLARKPSAVDQVLAKMKGAFGNQNEELSQTEQGAE